MKTDSPVFQALYEHWRRVKNPAKKARISSVLLASKAKAAEIATLRMERARERQTDTCRPELDGTRLTGAMHPLEHEACKILCPMLEVGRGSVKTKGWEWVMRQPWANDLQTAPLGRRFY